MFVIANKILVSRPTEYLRTVVCLEAGTSKVIWKYAREKALVFKTRESAQNFINMTWGSADKAKDIGIYIVDTDNREKTHL